MKVLPGLGCSFYTTRVEPPGTRLRVAGTGVALSAAIHLENDYHGEFVKKFGPIALACLMLTGNIVRASETPWLEPAFYSDEGRERAVSFRGTFRTELDSLTKISSLSADQKRLFVHRHIEPTLQFLFGPLTHRNLGGPQRVSWTEVDWAAAKLVDGKVNLPYEHQGVWLVDKSLPDEFSLPVPFNRLGLMTPKWRRCTDAAPAHQTEWFYWYYWDPERPGCDHREGVQYEIVNVKLGAETLRQAASYPEYSKLFESAGGEERLQLTFAFGYAEDPASPDPEKDWDPGALEYRKFADAVSARVGPGLTEEPILQGEYRQASRPQLRIGRRFSGEWKGRKIVINVVIAAGIDQMDLFAESFAHDHDGFFGWFGHSRVGSGFDAERFWRMTVESPDYYSVTPNYQLVYWGGCNSYSYYTLPFFEFKAHIANGGDLEGTKGLDLIANGLPSYFHFNADNADIMLKHLLDWEARPSYQTIVNEIEARARKEGVKVLVAVLGDEDNP